MFHILGIDHLVLRTGNVTALMRFYVDVLGCSLERVQPDFGLIQLRRRRRPDRPGRAGRPARPRGRRRPGQGRPEPRLTSACASPPFDADALGAHLRAHGVEPGPVEVRFGAEGKGPSIYVQDPDGNVVELKGPPANM
ncbi:VOC family protein [Cupriavidus basilensis]